MERVDGDDVCNSLQWAGLSAAEQHAEKKVDQGGKEERYVRTYLAGCVAAQEPEARI